MSKAKKWSTAVAEVLAAAELSQGDVARVSDISRATLNYYVKSSKVRGVDFTPKPPAMPSEEKSSNIGYAVAKAVAAGDRDMEYRVYNYLEAAYDSETATITNRSIMSGAKLALAFSVRYFRDEKVGGLLREIMSLPLTRHLRIMTALNELSADFLIQDLLWTKKRSSRVIALRKAIGEKIIDRWLKTGRELEAVLAEDEYRHAIRVALAQTQCTRIERQKLEHEILSAYYKVVELKAALR